MRVKSVILIIVSLCALPVVQTVAQENKVAHFDVPKSDTVHHIHTPEDYILPDLKADIQPVKTPSRLSTFPNETQILGLPVNPMDSQFPKIDPNALPDFKHLTPQLPSFADFYSTHTGVTGLMDTHAVGMGKQFTTGPFIFYGGSSLTQVGSVFGGAFTMPSINGSIGIKVTDRITIGGFGQFTGTNYHGMMPLTFPELPSNRFGGFVQYKISEHFSLRATYNREFNPITRKWENKWGMEPVFH